MQLKLWQRSLIWAAVLAVLLESDFTDAKYKKSPGDAKIACTNADENSQQEERHDRKSRSP